MMLTEFLQGVTDFVAAVETAYTERRRGFSEREAGDYLDAAGTETSPGEVSDEPNPPTSSPSPGDRPRCADHCPQQGLMFPPDRPILCDLPAGHGGEHVSYEDPDRAIWRWPRADVSHEDLAAHITAIRRSDYTITRK